MLRASRPRLPKREVSTKITDSSLPMDRDIPKGETVTKASATELRAERVGVRSDGDDRDTDVADNTESSTTTDETEEEEEEEEDHRTWRENVRAALWTVPNPDPVDIQAKEISSRSFKDYTRAARLTWSDYNETWEGFFNNFKNRGEKEDDNDNDDDDITTTLDTDAIMKKREELKGNTKRNVKALREEGNHALEFAKESTGVRNKKDMKKWVAKQIKLASLCVNEFMQGYREGRDNEVDKMLNEYFKEFDEEEDAEITEKENQITTELEGVQSKELVEVQAESRKGGRRKRNKKRRKR